MQQTWDRWEMHRSWRGKTDQNEPERTQGVEFAIRESGSRWDRDRLHKRNAEWLSASPEELCSAVLVLQLHTDWDAGWREVTMTDPPILDFEIIVAWRSCMASSWCDCLHCCTELPAAVCCQCTSKLNRQQQLVTSVLANWTSWTASSSLLPACKQTEQTELQAAVCYQCASKLNKLNCKQQLVTSVLVNWTNWTGSSSLLPVC